MEKRAEQINVRLTPKELALIEGKATAAKTTVTELVRTLALGRKVAVQYSRAPDFTTRDELRRIGVNLNQIARVLNAGGAANSSDLTALCGKLDSLFDEWLEHGSEGRPARP